METTSLHELFIKELQDLYDAEKQLIKALPKMAKAAGSDELREGFEEHLEQTKEHTQRLEQIFENLGEDAKGEKCKGMEGLIREGSKILRENMEEPVKDAALISAAQRVEHYEIAAYGTVRTWANQMQHEEAASLLEQTLSEEKETDQKLTRLAESINVEAEKGGEQEEERETRASKATTRRRRAA
jgi:ferritin-like metal-binding protein YciE